MAYTDYEYDYTTEDGCKHFRKKNGKGRGFFIRSSVQNADGSITRFCDMSEEEREETRQKISSRLLEGQVETAIRKMGEPWKILAPDAPKTESEITLRFSVNPAESLFGLADHIGVEIINTEENV